MRIQRLKEARTFRKLSQQDLAERVEMSLNQIGRYERGEGEPTAGVLIRLAQTLDVSTDYLLGLTDEPLEQDKEGLAPDERELISAYRRGDLREGMKIFINGPHGAGV